MTLPATNPLAIIPGQRAIAVGRTGSGKTTLARYIMAVSPVRWVILDRKADDGLAKDGGAVIERLPEPDECLELLEDAPSIIVRPPPSDFRTGAVDEFILTLHDAVNHIGLMVDELLSLQKNGQAGDGLVSWLTRGRSKGQAFLGLAQRPAWISQFLFSEADIIYCMALNKEDDRKRVYDFVGDRRVMEKLPKRQYWRYAVDDDLLQKGAPVTIASDGSKA